MVSFMRPSLGHSGESGKPNLPSQLQVALLRGGAQPDASLREPTPKTPLDRALHGLLREHASLTEMPPFSDNRRDWLSLNEGTVRHLHRLAARSASPMFVDVVDAVHGLASADAWKEMQARRGVDFHRRRGSPPHLDALGRGLPRRQTSMRAVLLACGPAR